ncbi:MAG TPA: AtpZ/AtpI family protein [Pseudonocardiaceae bacterium]
MAEKQPNVWTLVQVGSTMAVMVAGGLLLGWFADQRFHTLPIFVFVGLAVGITGACYYVYAKFRRFW